uniref:Uncharacterized protein n=1 Tax=Parascaris univalens TaxID=6257 RepID=A0A914ZZE0_PARUN
MRMSSQQPRSQNVQHHSEHVHRQDGEERDIDPKDPAANEAAKKIQHAYRKHHEHLLEEQHKNDDCA